MDKPYDETVDVQDSEIIVTPRNYPDDLKVSSDDDDDEDEDEDDNDPNDDEEEEENTDDDEEEDSDEDIFGLAADYNEGMYNPAKYEHMVVTSEIKELFEYIKRYKPHTELETKLRPFIPEYIAAVGDIDAFLKVPRPDGRNDLLGLTILDEPSIKQSDPSVLDLQLRVHSKKLTTSQVAVSSVEDAKRNPKLIDNWIKNIKDLFKSKPLPTVHYTKNMPELNDLMCEWSKNIEDCLKIIELPSCKLDCTLKEYVDIVCAILDIPIYNNRIHSLHLLFSLYLEFKNSQHFNQSEQ